MLFSIVIPTYNYAQFLPRTLDSILAQQSDDYEVLIVDDGSTDDTAEILKDYLKKSSSIRYVRQPNRGAAAARNHGARQSLGDYIVFLDADDEMLPQALERFRNAIERHGAAVLLGGHLSSGQGNMAVHHAPVLSENRTQNFDRFLQRHFGMPPGAVLLNKRVLARLSFPEGMKNYEDTVLFAQALALFPAASFADPVLKVNKHGGSARGNIDALLQQPIDAAADALFDPAVLPATLMNRREAYYSRLCLSRSRACYEAGLYKEGRDLYLRALRSRPAHIFELSYLRKYLRMLLGRAS